NTARGRGGWRSWRSRTPHRRYRRGRSRGRSGPASPRFSGDRAPSRVSSPTPPPEGDQGAQPHDQSGADRQERVDEHVALRKLRLLREPVEGRLAEEQEERVETAQVAFRVRAVELGVFVAVLSELLDPLLGDARQIVAEAEPDRLGRARLCAGGPEAVVDPVGPCPLRLLGRELVPLLAGDLAGATPDAQGNVCEHRERACHGYASFLTLQRRAFDS